MTAPWRVSLLRSRDFFRARARAGASTVALVAACATPHVAVPVGDAECALLSEPQALLAIQEALVRRGALAQRGYP
ncbi:MAG: hypothetical protein RLZZ450_7151, partial [Pseudomonadota bacterium]